MAGSSQFNERNMEIKGLAGSTMMVMEKLEKIDPDNASKIVGHLLSLEHGEQEMINLAHVSDDMFLSFIEKTREELNLPPIVNRKDKQPMSKLSTNFTPYIPSASRFPRAPSFNSVQIGNCAPMIQSVINNFEYVPVPYFCPPSHVVGLHHHPKLLPMEAQMESGFPNVPEGAWNTGLIRGPFWPDMRYYQQHNYVSRVTGESMIKSDDTIKFSIWSLTEDDSYRLARKAPTTSLYVEDEAASSHVPHVHADAGPSAPRGVSIGSSDRGKCIVTDADEEERYKRKGKTIITDATDTTSSDLRFNDIGKITITDADDEEASFNDKGKTTVTDADEEGRYGDLNLPDNPFAFEASAYDFALMMGRPEWDQMEGGARQNMGRVTRFFQGANNEGGINAGNGGPRFNAKRYGNNGAEPSCTKWF